MTELPHAVFLSYASQDAKAAQRICEALRAAGIEVWLDQSELRGGDAWDETIRVKTSARWLDATRLCTRSMSLRSDAGYARCSSRLLTSGAALIAH